MNPAYERFVREEPGAAGLDLWLNHWGAAFDGVMEHPATYFFSHEGHPSTAVHRIVGKKLFEEIAAHPPASP